MVGLLTRYSTKHMHVHSAGACVVCIMGVNCRDDISTMNGRSWERGGEVIDDGKLKAGAIYERTDFIRMVWGR